MSEHEAAREILRELLHEALARRRTATASTAPRSPADRRSGAPSTDRPAASGGGAPAAAWSAAAAPEP